MSGKRYTDEFKVEAVKQVTARGHSVAEVAEQLGITTHSLYAWKTKFDKPDVMRRAEVDQSAEVRHLKAENKAIVPARHQVANSMRRQRLRAKAARKYKATTNSNHSLPVAPNLLQQNFHADRANQA